VNSGHVSAPLIVTVLYPAPKSRPVK
jgi:hypothetical protein